MSTQKVIISGIVGGIVYFFLGWLLYGILLKDFMMAHESLPAGISGAIHRTDKEMMKQMLYLIAGNMAFGFLLSIIFGRWAGVTTLVGGLIGGAMLGFLISGGMDCIMYATTNLMSRTGMAVDVLIFTVLSAVAGAVVGWMLGMGSKE